MPTTRAPYNVKPNRFIRAAAAVALILAGTSAMAAPPPGAGGGGGKNKGPTCTITLPANDPVSVNSGDNVTFEATAQSGSAPYDVIWSLPGSDQTELQDSIAASRRTSSVTVSYLA